MEFRYMGFDQKGDARVFRFDCLVKGEPARHFTISANMGLFLSHHVAIQEGPTLCSIKLAADVENNTGEVHELTAEDLSAYASTVSAAAARKAESRKSTPRRAPEGGAFEASPWRTSRTV